MPETETETLKVRKKSEVQVEKEMKKLKAFLKAVIPESYDKYDLKAHYDSSLTYMENKNIIIDEIKQLFADEYKGATHKEQVAYAKAEQEKFNKQRDEAIEKEILEYNKRNYVENKELNQFYSNVHRAISKMCQGYSNLAFIKGRGAVGKSWNIRKMLIQKKTKYTEICGDITEAYLYRLLFEHNGEIIWFRDIVRLLRGMNSINLLKSATETETERLLTKNSYSKAQSDLPDRFLYKGKIIFDYNEIAGIMLKDDFEALQTRGDYVDVALSIDDVKAIMKLIAVEDWQNQVTDFLIKHYEFTGQNLLNLRTQWKAFKTYEYCQKNNLDWKVEIKEEMKSSISKVRGMLYSLMGKNSIRTTDLKKLLMKYGVVNTIRTAHRKINDWILTDELFRWSAEDRDFFVGINPPNLKTTRQYELNK